MSPKKPKKPRPSEEESAAAERQWADLVTQFKLEWPRHVESRLKSAHLLYEMKRWLKQWGWHRGCKGRWKELLGSFLPPIPRSTADDYVRLWQEHMDMPPEDCVLARLPISHKNCKNNLPESGKLATPAGTGAKIKAANDEDADKSVEHRIGVECVFVLTMVEKHKFMDAVKALGPLQATQEMYKAVIAKAAGAAPKVDGVGA
jgi:hypothetical protein